KDRTESVCNHFGIATLERPAGDLVWIHAASIGESTAALTYIKHLKKQFPQLNILLTTITVTSADMLYPKIASIAGCCHQFAVADSVVWVRKFLDYWRPNAAFFLESEIWPNIVDSLFERKIPAFLLNARLSFRSFARWRPLKSFFADTLRKFTCILAQSETDVERFSFFSPENAKRIDNLKYANELLPCNDELLNIFRKICAGKKVFVAASTHEKEEQIILEAHKKLKSTFDLVTFIIPRHLTRVKRICEICDEYEVKYSLRSEENFSADCEVFCVDTFGEVGTFFRLADICFVGGSLAPIGGHNIYEPVALGKPVLHGPFMDNAMEARDLLGRKQAAFQINNADEICKICSRLLSDSAQLKKVSEFAAAAAKNESLKQIDDIIRLPKYLSDNPVVCNA
ncbi:MAG: 3-deoxy-D-manno-octulosonic acid transferase, partial [Holosporaceae bacterium]|nr:3-deoxy-D-manno-octulosonic acid transferase [Holosporaceae bacterium]